MIFRRFLDVYQCSDSLCLSDCFFVLGEVVGDIAVLLPPSWIWFGGGLARCSSWFFHAYRCFDISFWNDYFRVLRYGESFGLVCCDGLVSWLVFWSALFYLVFLVWFLMVLTICTDWLFLVSSVWSFLSVLVWRGPGRAGQVWSRCSVLLSHVLCVRFGLHWSGQWCSAPGRRVLVKLSSVLFALVCSDVGPLCSTLDWSALVFLVSLFFYSLACLAQYVGRGQGSAAGAAEDHRTCL